MTNTEPILFYDQTLEYPELGNFYPLHEWSYDGLVTASSEAAYQASKFAPVPGCGCVACTRTDVAYVAAREVYRGIVASAKTGSRAFYLGRQYAPKKWAWGVELQRVIDGYKRAGVRPCSNWDDNKEQVMARILACKFDKATQPALYARLLGTGTRHLQEHTNRCSFWADGGGAPGAGKNRLGVLLMQLRQRLIDSCTRELVEPL